MPFSKQTRSPHVICGYDFDTKVFRFLKSSMTLVCPICVGKCHVSVDILFVSDMDTAFTLKCLCFIGCNQFCPLCMMLRFLNFICVCVYCKHANVENSQFFLITCLVSDILRPFGLHRIRVLSMPEDKKKKKKKTGNTE